jgi:endonuclease-8
MRPCRERTVPEGDTLFRTATVLREALLGKEVIAARGRPDGVQLGRVVGSRVERVDARGKHLLIDFTNGLTLHTHLRMIGSWHRYRSGQRWKRSPARAVAVIEVPGAVAVCFDAPTVELMDSRAVAIHPVLTQLGPDLLAPEPDLAEAVRRLTAPERAATPIGEALLDQTAVAGLGNVYRSEVCFVERVDPFAPVGMLPAPTVRRLVATGARLLHANRNDPRRVTVAGTAGRLWVYDRAGRPCRRCGTLVRSTVKGELPRTVWWCPSCQPPTTAPEEVPETLGATRSPHREHRPDAARMQAT